MTELEQLRKKIAGHEAVLKRAGDQFRRYEREHMKKVEAAPTQEIRGIALEKAKANSFYAELCENALAGLGDSHPASVR